MDRLTIISKSLSDEEKRAFRTFIQRFRHRKDRKDLELFDWINKGVVDHESHMQKLYGKRQQTAYHALRKRLVRHLSDFILVNSMESDVSGASVGISWYYLAKHLFDHHQEDLAHYYLNKAEKAAATGEQYELLRTVLNLKIEQAATHPDVDLDALIKRHRKYALLANAEERARMANSLVRQEMERYRLEGKRIDIDLLVNRVLESYQLRDAVTLSPRLLYNLVSMARSAILVRKEFHSFVPFVTEYYNKMLEQGGFKKKNRFYQLGMLYMLAHTLFRVRHFGRAKNYLLEMEYLLSDGTRAEHLQYHAKYLQLMAAVHAFTGNPAEGAKLLQDELAANKDIEPFDKLNMKASLGVYSFQAGDLSGAHDALLGIYHSDQWCTKVMGVEWVFKKTLMEAILFVELDEVDLAESRIRSAERNFSKLLADPAYSRAKQFLRLVSAAIFKPLELQTEAFAERVKKQIQFVPAEEEDLQSMAFYAWLKSKMQNRDYQDVLLELV
jgi:hypothetical protein